MRLFPDMLRPGDVVPGWGEVQRVNTFHKPGCGHQCHNSCDPVNRTVVRFMHVDEPYIFAGTTELEVSRPGPEPEYQPHMLGRDDEDS